MRSREQDPFNARHARSPTMMDRAMIQAATMGLAGAVASFLADGANPNGTDEHGVPILHLAFSHQSDEESIEAIARAMVAAGANPRASHGEGPGLPERIIRVFGAPQAERLLGLVVSLGFDIDARGVDGRTALMWAIDAPAGSDRVLEALLRSGADPALEDARGRSAYARAQASGREQALIKMAVSQERSTLSAAIAPAPSKRRLPL